jgi:hypothetical protein
MLGHLFPAEGVSPWNGDGTHEFVRKVILFDLPMFDFRFGRLDFDLQVHLDVELFAGSVANPHPVLDVHHALVKVWK